MDESKTADTMSKPNFKSSQQPKVTDNNEKQLSKPVVTFTPIRATKGIKIKINDHTP